MYNTNDLLLRIQSGEDPEAIANEFAGLLNDVIELDRKQKAEEAAKEKAAAAQKDKEEKLNALAQSAIDAIVAYINLANPEVAKLLENETFEVSEIRSTLDAVVASLSAAVNLIGLCGGAVSAPSKPSADASIVDFLKRFVD